MSHPMARVEGSPTNTFIRGVSQPLVSARGEPTVPSHVERALEEYNRARGTQYRIRWQASAWGTSYYALFEQWGPNDPRRQRLQDGTLDPSQSKDLVTMFPPEVRAEEMLAWMERNLRGFSANPAGDAERIVEARTRQHGALVEHAVDTSVEQGTERIMSESDHLRRVRSGTEAAHPMVTVGADIGSREPKRLILTKPDASEAVGA